MECLAVINQKGGVGKTATTANLGAALAERGLRVLLIDLDPQAHLSAHLGLDDEAGRRGAYELLTGAIDAEAAVHAVSDRLAVVPSRIDLAAAEVELVSVVGREVILRDAMAQRDLAFDVALIDCPPSLGILTLNALCAATQVLIPVQPHFLALQGVGKLLETIALVNQRINRSLRVAGMVICMYESGTRLGGEVIDDLSAFLDHSRDGRSAWHDARVFETRIRRNVRLAEAPSYGKSILEYAPKSNGAADYLALADELLATVLEGLAPKSARSAASDAAPVAATEPGPDAPTVESGAAPPAPAANGEKRRNGAAKRPTSPTLSPSNRPDHADPPIEPVRPEPVESPPDGVDHADAVMEEHATPTAAS